MFFFLRLFFVIIVFVFFVNVILIDFFEFDFIIGFGYGGGVCSLIVFYIWKEINIVIIMFINCLCVFLFIGI